MWTGYLAVGDIELANIARAHAYTRALCGTTLQAPDCPTLTEALGHQPYTTPENEAPWWDPGEPASTRVLGFVGLAWQGLGKATLERTAIPVVGDGSIITTGRRGHRELTLTLMVIALDEPALEYATAWLTAQLAAVADGTVHGYTTCPSPDTAPRLARSLIAASLLDPPELLSVRRLPGGRGHLATIECVIATGPGIYRDPVTVLPPTGFQPPTPDSPCLEWTPVATGNCGTAPCSGGASCAHDPLCPPAPPAPYLPVPSDPCSCTDVADPAEILASLNTDQIAHRLPAAPLITVTAGTSDLRIVTARLAINPTGQACTSVVGDECAYLTSVTVPYVPAGATVHIDYRTQRVTLACADSTTGAIQPLGPNGGAVDWHAIPTPARLCAYITAVAPVSAAATATIALATAEDTA